MRLSRRWIMTLFVGLFALASVNVDAAVLKRGTSSEPDTLDPQLSFGGTAAIILYDLFEGLMTVDGAGKIIPGVAEKMEVSADGRIYTFTLRENLAWSDGAPLTAEDFVYSMRRIVDPQTAARYATLFFPIQNARAIARGQAPLETLGVKAKDARTVEFTLERPNASFPKIVAGFSSSPVPRHVIEKEGRGWTQAGKLVSNGAFSLQSIVPQTSLTVVKNPRFHAASSVKLEAVEYYPTENLTTSLNRFRAGELDIILNVPPERVAWLKENLPKALRISPSLGVYYFAFNHKQKPFDDVHVRQALSIAIDREAMVERLLPTGVTPARGIVPPMVSNYAPEAQPLLELPIAERQKRARELLAAAGFGPQNPLNVKLEYDTLEENRQIAVAMSAMWKAIGVNTEQVNTDSRTLTGKLRSGEFQIGRTATFAAYDDPTVFLILLDSRNTAGNVSRYANPAFEALLDEAEGILDPSARMAKLAEAEKLAMADYPILPLYFYSGRRLVSEKVQGWTDNPSNVNTSRFLSLSP
jgi:oligopeptide transport system substrate-binding protein